MSARELGRELEAADLRRIDRLNDAITMAWKTAQYHRLARGKRRLPNLQREWIKDDAPTRKRPQHQSREQFNTTIRMLAAMYGGKIERVEVEA